MLKRIVSPFQKVLLNRRMCVGCTFPLDKATIVGQLSEKKTMIQCKCNRRYILDKELNSFRRATFEEEQLFLSNKIK